jgi:hypothetical protein
MEAARRRGGNCSEHSNSCGIMALPGWAAARFYMVAAARLPRCAGAPGWCHAGSERGQQIWRALEVLVPRVPPSPPKATNIHHHIVTAKVFGSLSQSLPKTSLDTCTTIWYQMYSSMTGRNPKHDNVPQGYCVPPAPLLWKARMNPTLLTMPLDSSFSCSGRARKRSPRPPFLVSPLPVSAIATSFPRRRRLAEV